MLEHNHSVVAISLPVYISKFPIIKRILQVHGSINSVKVYDKVSIDF